MRKNEAMLKILLSFTLSYWTFAYEIIPGSITVSGISSGAHFATQFHLAHSNKIQGAALVAGGPYYCSNYNLSKALSNCMKGEGEIDTDDLVKFAKTQSYFGLLSSSKNLTDDKVFILAGKNDSVIQPKVINANKDFYLGLNVKEENIKLIDYLSVGHAFPTGEYGNPCETPQKTPYLSACQYDTAKEILNFFYLLNNDQTEMVEENLKAFSQQPYHEISLLLSNISLANEGYAYIPKSCQQGQHCKLHISFHGCEMSYGTIGNEYIKNAGFNNWAENNNIIMVYPQTIKNIMIGNPHGCWDWWGYSGPNFSNKYGPQIQIIDSIIRKFSSPSYRI